jgi:hypothetical protein
MADGLSCMNCKRLVEPSRAKLFAEVFVCEDCHTMAVHFWDKLDRELRYLLVMAKESIRLALLEGKFSFPEGGAQEVSKREVLQAILRMQEAREKSQCPTELQGLVTPSMENTLPVAPESGVVGS